MDRGEQISLRGLNRLFDAAERAKNFSATAAIIDTSGGNPIIIAEPDLKRWVTAHITDYARQEDDTPLLDYNGFLQWQWTEAERYIDGTGFPAWRDIVADQPRGSVEVAPGVYLNLAHGAEPWKIPDDYVILWAGVVNRDNKGDYEHIFEGGNDAFAVAQRDWRLQTPFNLVLVQLCTDMSGSVPFGPLFPVYFLNRAGHLDPAVFQADEEEGTAADVITIDYDYDYEQFYPTSPDVYDDQLGTVKFWWDSGGSPIGIGWAICDGTTPAHSKIGKLPDTRGLFSLPLDAAGVKWTDAAAQGPVTADVTVSHKPWGSDNPPANIKQVVDQVEDAASWAGAAVGPPSTVKFVSRPPSFVLTQIIRYK